MGQELMIIAVSLALGTLTYGLIARWVVMPALTVRPRAEALFPLLLP